MTEPAGITTEYILLVAPVRGDETGLIQIGLRTTREFRNFEYALNVETKLDGKSLVLTILGLSAPDLKLPSTGPAHFSTELPLARGTWDITVSKHGKASNTFTVKVTAAGVKVDRMDDVRFVDIVTRYEDW